MYRNYQLSSLLGGLSGTEEDERLGIIGFGRTVIVYSLLWKNIYLKWAKSATNGTFE